MPVVDKRQPTSPLIYATLVLSLIALLASGISLFNGRGARNTDDVTSQQTLSTLQKTKLDRILRVAYSGFPPYTIVDPNEQNPNKRVSGICVDIINAIADRQIPPWNVEWHKITWESLRADMYRGSFDLFADAVYQTIPRAAEFAFTEPFSYFGVAVAVVRHDETRFLKFEDLAQPGIKVSLAEGWTSTEYARKHLPPENLAIKPVGDDPNIQFQDVMSGRADAALQDAPTVIQFVRAHPRQVKALWLDRPPLRVAASFMTRQGPDNAELLHFISTCLKIMQVDGTIDEIDAKWQGYGEYLDPSFKTGAGLRDTE